MLEDRVEETEASYPDSGSVRDSRDGSPDESEEVVHGASDGDLKLQVWAPLPKHQGHVVGHLWGPPQFWGLTLSSPSGLAIPLVKVTIGFLVHPQSPTWMLIHLSHNG